MSTDILSTLLEELTAVPGPCRRGTRDVIGELALLVAAVHGDAPAQEAFQTKYVDRAARNVIGRYSNVRDVCISREDLAQEAYKKLISIDREYRLPGWRKFDGRGSLHGWIETMMENRVRDQRRPRRGAVAQVGDVLDEIADDNDPDPVDQVADRMTGEELRAFIRSKCDPITQVVVILRADGFPPKFISQLCKIPNYDVTRRYQQTIKRFEAERRR